MRERLGDDLEIIFQKVESIPRTKSGKFNLVVSKVKPGSID